MLNMFVLLTTIIGKESDAKGEKGKTETKTTKVSTVKKDGKDDKSAHRRASPAIKSLDDVRREKRERQMRERRERERRDRIRRERERIMREKAMERERERMRQRERERRRVQLLREREERERQERLRLERERERERMRQRELERERERERQERDRMRLIQERQLREDRERLERERERLERERLQRLERERMERQRAEERRGVKRPGDPYVRQKSPTRGPGYWPDAKRPAPDSREFFSGMSGRDRAARDIPEARPAPSRERRGDPRGGHSDPRSGHADPRGSHSTRDEPPREDHRRTERDRPSASRSSRETPRERESRDRRPSWEHGAESSSDPQKGLSLLLQRAGVSGLLGNDVGSRSTLPKSVVPSAGGSSSRGESWNDRSSAHARPIMSSHSLDPSGNPVARVGRPVISDAARGWPEKEHDRSRERDRGVATRDISRSAWTATNPSSAMMPPSIDRSRTVIPPSRGSVLPPRMISHSVPPMVVPVIDSRRAVVMSGRSDPFRGAPVPSISRSGTMRRY